MTFAPVPFDKDVVDAVIVDVTAGSAETQGIVIIDS